ncbi:unnamed protein product [Vitrella brassicaformis CCMP3155]|uniref:Peptide chain release factor domain-containing protein n=1 Tax=Vitrella brassicaformis (strain CCMP3155) TaxID=1169540 RepID=A0A0G4EWX8_VITBC|nr:unnamed protein product [Vitrella brassicaformis CCMP3155]|eukprot:CEM03497.1 unnamed protein product [Vitrella brassicaformis CCMP3155]
MIRSCWTTVTIISRYPSHRLPCSGLLICRRFQSSDAAHATDDCGVDEELITIASEVVKRRAFSPTPPRIKSPWLPAPTEPPLAAVCRRLLPHCEHLVHLAEELKVADSLLTEGEGGGEGDSAFVQRERAAVLAKVREVEGKMEEEMLNDEGMDARDVILEVRPGVGGQEACLFARELFHMYESACTALALTFTPLDVKRSSEGGGEGYREAIAEVSGSAAAPHGWLKWEGGVHRVQRVPKTERMGRIHTSAASVVVLPKADTTEVSISSGDLKIESMRGSGPGGQSVNMADTAVRITHKPTKIAVKISNRVKAMSLLRARLFDIQRRTKAQAASDVRAEHQGTGDRSEKIRTYNYTRDTVTDHRGGISVPGAQALLQTGHGFIPLIGLIQAQHNTAALHTMRRELIEFLLSAASGGDGHGDGDGHVAEEEEVPGGVHRGGASR